MADAPQITIDGRTLAFESGQTILDVAAANGIAIPTLCYLPEAGHRDVCRLCVVEVAGAGRMLPACSTPATEGMDVQTMSERVRSSRRATLELIIGSGRHTCITCEALGECELSRLAYEYQVEPPSDLPGRRGVPAHRGRLRHPRLLQVHPLRPLLGRLHRHPGPRRGAASLRPARGARRRQGLVPAAGPRPVRALRPVRRRLPRRGAHRAHRQGRGPALGAAARAHHLPALRHGLPDRRAPQGRRGGQGDRRRRRAAQPRPPLQARPLRRARAGRARPPRGAAACARTACWSRRAGTRRSTWSPRSSARPAAWPASSRPCAPTRRPIRRRSSSAPCSAPTTSTTAPSRPRASRWRARGRAPACATPPAP